MGINVVLVIFFCGSVEVIKGEKLVEAHGSFSMASCVRCKSKQDPEVVKVCVCVCWCGCRFNFSLSVRQQFSVDRLQDVVISIVW